MATPAPCCVKALADATLRWRNRSTASDGIVGARNNPSDHPEGNAFDLTHDPADGCDCNPLALQVVGDRRVKYAIWNRRIWSRARAKEGWRPYDGASPHTDHLHVSILPGARDDLSPWPWSPPSGPGGKPPYPGELSRHKRSKGEPVRALQRQLNRLVAAGLEADGDFGAKTEAAVKGFQRKRRLTADGIVGPKTWAALWA